MYRILIVEDDESIASVIRKQLEMWGLEAAGLTDFIATKKDWGILPNEIGVILFMKFL